MDFSGHSKAESIDYSPPQAAMRCPEQQTEYYDNSYLEGIFNPTSEYSMNTFDTESFFNQPLTSVEMSSGFPSKPQTAVNPILPATGLSASNNDNSNNKSYQQIPNPDTYQYFDRYPSSFYFTPISTQSKESNCFSPETTATSQTPSLCGDAAPETVSPSLSPHILKRESPSSPTSGSDSSTPKRSLRKRGRPKLDRSTTELSSKTPSSAKCQRAGRLPHNQVERKYREGLNLELERLRKAVPSLRQIEDGGIMGQTKPSKAMVLSSAIEYIRSVERERDTLKAENEALRQERFGMEETKRWTGGDDALGGFFVNT